MFLLWFGIGALFCLFSRVFFGFYFVATDYILLHGLLMILFYVGFFVFVCLVVAVVVIALRNSATALGSNTRRQHLVPGRAAGGRGAFVLAMPPPNRFKKGQKRLWQAYLKKNREKKSSLANSLTNSRTNSL